MARRTARRELLAQRTDVKVLLHPQNRGYGAALKTAFDYAIENQYELVVTIDCDGQHEPQRICDLAAACRHFDIASGSRYLETPASTAQVPSDRLSINRTITKDLNERLGLKITDAFCGFKAYRSTALTKLNLSETRVCHATGIVGPGRLARLARDRSSRTADLLG